MIDWIADEALGGDRDAAEWVLLACVARVYVPHTHDFSSCRDRHSYHPPPSQSRTRSLNPPSLTLAHFPSQAPPSPSSLPSLSDVLTLLLPLHVTLPLSLDLLNSARFAPESINEDLHSGYLQLAHGTTMLMTEDGIQEGKLVERGVLNVRTIQQVINTQTLDYKFPFSEFSFPTDVSFVILAQGSKSALFQVRKQKKRSFVESHC